MNRKTRYDADSTAYAFTYAQDNGYAYSFYDFGERTHFSSDDSDNDNWTFEARVSTPSDSNSRWAGIVGFFYANSEDHTVFTANGTGLSGGCVDGGAARYCGAYHAKRSSYLHYYYFGTFGHAANNWWTGDYMTNSEDIAVFGEISFDVTDNFTITAGGRWFEVKETRFNANGGQINLPNARPVPVFDCYSDAEMANWLNNGVAAAQKDFCFNEATANSKESDWVPKVNASYKFDDDKLVYFTYSEGFRRGGVNASKQGPFSAGGALHEYTSDSIENFEVGFKSTWMDGSFRLNATFYHMIWKDVQIQVNDPTGTFFALGIVNLAEAEIDGVEAHFEWLPAENWNFSGNLGFNDAALSEDIPDVGFGVALDKGERMPLMAKWKTSLSAEYTVPQEILGADPYVKLGWNYKSNSLNSLAGLGALPVLIRQGPTLHTIPWIYGLA